jgi:ribosomal protein S18 acetylase RimI-like enzyme
MLEIREEIPSLEALAHYAAVPISFFGHSRFQVIQNGDKWNLSEETVPEFFKDYDTLERPIDWFTRFDMSKWIIFSAFQNDVRIGSLIVAFNTPGVYMLEGRTDLALLWDIRIATEFRNRGIGSLLFEKAVMWSMERGCTELKVETQDINVAACRFYAKMGFQLRTIRHNQYPGLPDEIQFLWYREL